MDGYRQDRRGWEVAFYVMTIIESMKLTVGNGRDETLGKNQGINK